VASTAQERLDGAAEKFFARNRDPVAVVTGVDPKDQSEPSLLCTVKALHAIWQEQFVPAHRSDPAQLPCVPVIPLAQQACPAAPQFPVAAPHVPAAQTRFASQLVPQQGPFNAPHAWHVPPVH
jgi:hypothetical protein